MFRSSWNLVPLLTAVLLIMLALVTLYAQDKNSSAGKTESAAAEAQKAAPVLTDQQKTQIKDFQLTDSQLDNSILRAQQKQVENQQRAQAYIGTLCRSQDGKTYQVHFPDLSCAAVPTTAQK